MTREIKTKITADPSNFQKGVDGAQAKLKVFTKEVRSSASDFAKWGAAGLAASSAIGAALFKMSADGAKELRSFAQVSNESTQEMVKMAHATRTVDIQMDKLSDILKDVNDRVGDFVTTGGGPMADFFEKIAPKVGITADSFRDLSGSDALQLYVSSLEKANVSQAEMTFYMEAMAGDSSKLIPLLKDNGRLMGELADQADKLGLAMSDFDNTQLINASNSIEDARRVSEAFVNQLSAKFAPIVEEISNLLLDVSENAGGVGAAAESAFNKAISAGAFVADAVDGVGRTFEVLGKTAAVVGLGIGEAMLSVADFIVNRPVEAVNELIEVLNTLPGVNITPVSLIGFGETIQQELGILRGAIDEGLSDIDAVLQRPLAGSEFKKFVDEVQSGAMDRYVTNAEEAAAKAAEAIRAGKETEAGHIAEWDEVINQMVMDAREKKFEDAANEEQFLNDLIAQGEQKRYEILAESAQKQQMLDKMQAAARKAALGDMMDNLASLMGSKSRKMFEIGKVAAIANTVVSTMQGAQQAYTSLSSIPVVGPALGIAAAGAAIAAGAVRVQAINAQSFSKGTVSTAAASQTSQNIGSQVATGQGGPSQIQYIQGINPGDLYSGSQLVDLINNAQENGAKLVIL